MSTGRRQREGIIDINGEQDPLMKALEDSLDKCGAALGVSGCSACPVEGKCNRLWEKEASNIERLSLTELRRLTQKFALLKQERDCILSRRQVAAITPRKTY